MVAFRSRAARAVPAVALLVAMAACGGDDRSGDSDDPSPTIPSATAPPASPSPTPAVTEAPSATPTATAATPSPSATPTVQTGPISLGVEEVGAGFERPTFVTHAGDGSGRLFVLEKAGRIRIIAQDGAVADEPFLDLTGLVRAAGNEQGLLGLAFHPEFAANGRLFVYYTATDGGANTLAEYHAEPGDGSASLESARVLFALPDNAANHNGGMLAFGPDGYLYVGTGDGGGTPERSQDLASLFGKILRLDVDGGEEPYGIPADNPFVGQGSAQPEIWALGLRNPWRFSFDRETGELWIADVGQNAIEEVNVQPGDAAGVNYGWVTMEGSECYRPGDGCNTAGLTLPAFEYTHAEGCSVTGGYTYRGAAQPGLWGRYVFVDYCAGELRVLTPDGAGSWEHQFAGSLGARITSFGEDEAGEIYLADDGEGAIYRLVVES